MPDSAFPEGKIIESYLAGDLTIDAAATAFIDGGHLGFSYEMSHLSTEQQTAVMALLRRTLELRLLRGDHPGA
jgi:hypothetical protein